VRGILGALLVIAGAFLLSGIAAPNTGPIHLLGTILIVSACACWGLDNNFTQRVSIRDTRQIVAIKGLVGGLVGLALAYLSGQARVWPPVLATLLILLLGAVSYGLSIVLFIRGLRELGVVVTGALFALAPGIAAVLSWIVLREPVHPGGLL